MGLGTYNHAPIYPNHEVEPWFHAQFQIGVAQHLESVAMTFLLLLPGVAVEARQVAIEGVKHGLVYIIRSGSYFREA